MRTFFNSRMTLWVLLFTGAAWCQDSTNAWGYGYDSLLQDLQRWKAHPTVQVDSIGASVQRRGLWMVTVTEGTDVGKGRIFVHARTHPGEVQAFRITREMIRFILDTTQAAKKIRQLYVFHFIPMYNPDGVELGYGRLNANRVDIESNWDKPTKEPEVLVLKAKFEALMNRPNPIRVALNLHSDRFNCTRFFFFHEASGTSPFYATLEQDFIGKVRAYFNPGIENWDFVRSWNGTTATQYPESFWWANHKESVMALTYEDANCVDAGEFDKTGRALVLGSIDYIDAHPLAIRVTKNDKLNSFRTQLGATPVFVKEKGAEVYYFDSKGRMQSEVMRMRR